MSRSIMGRSIPAIFLFLALAFLLSLNTNVSGCHEQEREALLKFKHGLYDPASRLSSWVGEDCCKWIGVGCMNTTGHVIMLDLRNVYFNDYGRPLFNSSLGGKIDSSLTHLKHLKYLDLSWNYFSMSHIPKYFGSLEHLRYLNLSRAYFDGTIPHQLGNLSKLHTLDLSDNHFDGMIPNQLGNLSKLHTLDLSDNHFDGMIPNQLGNLSNLHTLDLGYAFQPFISVHDLAFIGVDDLAWLSSLSFLQYLDLSGVNLTRALNWQQEINKVSSLKEIHLSECMLRNIHSSFPFANLTSINVLDFSINQFNSTLPHWLTNFSGLTHLELGGNEFSGSIPSTMGNLSSLEFLDLSYNSIDGSIPTSFNSLCNLRTLLLSGNSISSWERLPGCLANSLKELYLSSNHLTGDLLNWLTNFSSLTYLDLYGNKISGSMPSTMGNLTSLESLDLSYNSINGSIPTSFNSLCNLRILLLSGNSISSWERLTGCLANSLEDLDVSGNQLKENFQVWLGETSNMKTLKYLDLSHNLFSGFIPSSIGSLSSLQKLNLAINKLGGYIPQSIGKLSNLLYFDIAYNFFTLDWNVSSQWLPSNIQYIDISCGLHKKFPSWLKHHRNIQSLHMSNSSISDVVPDWFWNIIVNITYLDLSHNQLQGKLPNSFLQILDLSNNSFSGPILEKNMPNLVHLDISNNFLNGSIPSILCKLENLAYLDLSSNYLHGNIIDCWGNKSMSLWYINFSNNNFSGESPSSLSDIPYLASLHLRNNSLSGELPSTMKKMKSLVVLDLAHNKLSGVISTWIGENLSSLRILSLRSNMIYGNIPPQISNISSLQYLDLSYNNLSGAIPRSLGDLTVMTKRHNAYDKYFYNIRNVSSTDEMLDNIVMILKGVELENSGTLGLYNVIDLSVNSLSGEIPEELTRLLGLVSLNLSCNSLKGNIPNKIGALKQLESLDLSKNKLFGEIPSSLSTLNFLSKLNLSYNNLSGRIPSSFQLQTLNDSSIYIGNDNLCGPPLSPCPTYEMPPHTEIEREKDDESETTGFFVSIGLGIVIGFWGFCAVLIFKKSWRIAYYLFCDDIMEKVIVTMNIWLAILKRKIKKVREN